MPDLQVIQKLSQEAFSEVVDITLKSLAQKQQASEFCLLYKNLCGTANLEFSELEPFIQVLLQTCKEAIKKCKPLLQLKDELLNLGMNEDQVDTFSKKWENVYASLVQSTVADTVPINPLIDMEWKFGVTSASNQFNSVGNVFLQIKLEVDQGSGRSKTVCFELGLSEFYAFLHEMERARASLDYLS